MEGADYSPADLAARRWRVEAGLLRVAEEAERAFSLDPMHLDRLRDAEREQDSEGFYLAAVEALVATLKAQQERRR